MSKKNNVNPDHYKIAGRDRQGEDILQEAYKQRYEQTKARQAKAGQGRPNLIPGAPPVGESGGVARRAKKPAKESDKG